ncbi:hypothetical protein K210_04600 [Erysipelothrix rhusiopathiae SY1027]|nr:hypothetical protein K210_04600 [Erysipelothrix rhusiopathiae SY1027]
MLQLQATMIGRNVNLPSKQSVKRELESRSLRYTRNLIQFMVHLKSLKFLEAKVIG